MVKNIISEEWLNHYFDVTQRALNKVKDAGFDESRKEEALDFLDMAERYFKDASFFYSKGDFVNAFAAVNYAHGWLDAGARIGLFKVRDSKLFTVDDD
ncbi:MAG: uncharacterized protein PWP03_714 [Candidatus Woesearchaeota archaeon]|nr:uncharacterized protein [Candidatus Woesearchaeota archaeon]MDN5328076.1 uncharacterized protein [Candidatus Woesearchaeota archaeon]